MNTLYTSTSLLRSSCRTLAAGALCVLLASCGTARHAAKEASTPSSGVTSIDNRAQAYAQGVWKKRVEADCITASLSVSLDMNGRTVSCDGKLRMKRDDVVQISLTLPLIGTEVGRLECTPTEVLVVDRINRRYVRASYEEVDFLRQAGLDFYALQGIMRNELFAPGETKAENALHRFRLAENGAHTLLSLTDAPKLEYDFLTITQSQKIDRLTIRGKSATSEGEFTCIYGDFSKLSGRQFPTNVSLRFQRGGRTSSLSMSLSRLGTDGGWSTRTSLSDKYTRLQAADFLKILSF